MVISGNTVKKVTSTQFLEIIANLDLNKPKDYNQFYLFLFQNFEFLKREEIIRGAFSEILNGEVKLAPKTAQPEIPDAKRNTTETTVSPEVKLTPAPALTETKVDDKKAAKTKEELKNAAIKKLIDLIYLDGFELFIRYNEIQGCLSKEQLAKLANPALQDNKKPIEQPLTPLKLKEYLQRKNERYSNLDCIRELALCREWLTGAHYIEAFSYMQSKNNGKGLNDQDAANVRAFLKVEDSNGQTPIDQLNGLLKPENFKNLDPELRKKLSDICKNPFFEKFLQFPRPKDFESFIASGEPGKIIVRHRVGLYSKKNLHSFSFEEVLQIIPVIELSNKQHLKLFYSLLEQYFHKLKFYKKQDFISLAIDLIKNGKHPKIRPVEAQAAPQESKQQQISPQETKDAVKHPKLGKKQQNPNHLVIKKLAELFCYAGFDLLANCKQLHKSLSPEQLDVISNPFNPKLKSQEKPLALTDFKVERWGNSITTTFDKMEKLKNFLSGFLVYLALRQWKTKNYGDNPESVLKYLTGKKDKHGSTPAKKLNDVLLPLCLTPDKFNQLTPQEQKSIADIYSDPLLGSILQYPTPEKFGLLRRIKGNAGESIANSCARLYVEQQIANTNLGRKRINMIFSKATFQYLGSLFGLTENPFAIERRRKCIYGMVARNTEKLANNQVMGQLDRYRYNNDPSVAAVIAESYWNDISLSGKNPDPYFVAHIHINILLAKLHSSSAEDRVKLLESGIQAHGEIDPEMWSLFSMKEFLDLIDHARSQLKNTLTYQLKTKRLNELLKYTSTEGKNDLQRAAKLWNTELETKDSSNGSISTHTRKSAGSIEKQNDKNDVHIVDISPSTWNELNITRFLDFLALTRNAKKSFINKIREKITTESDSKVFEMFLEALQTFDKLSLHEDKSEMSKPDHASLIREILGVDPQPASTEKTSELLHKMAIVFQKYKPTQQTESVFNKLLTLIENWCEKQCQKIASLNEHETAETLRLLILLPNGVKTSYIQKIREKILAEPGLQTLEKILIRFPEHEKNPQLENLILQILIYKSSPVDDEPHQSEIKDVNEVMSSKLQQNKPTPDVENAWKKILLASLDRCFKISTLSSEEIAQILTIIAFTDENFKKNTLKQFKEQISKDNNFETFKKILQIFPQSSTSPLRLIIIEIFLSQSMTKKLKTFTPDKTLKVQFQNFVKAVCTACAENQTTNNGSSPRKHQKRNVIISNIAKEYHAMYKDLTGNNQVSDIFKISMEEKSRLARATDAQRSNLSDIVDLNSGTRENSASVDSINSEPDVPLVENAARQVTHMVTTTPKEEKATVYSVKAVAKETEDTHSEHEAELHNTPHHRSTCIIA